LSPPPIAASMTVVVSTCGAFALALLNLLMYSCVSLLHEMKITRSKILRLISL
jgi:hypothetical protein